LPLLFCLSNSFLILGVSSAIMFSLRTQLTHLLQEAG
jgi:hypothetical protein